MIVLFIVPRLHRYGYALVHHGPPSSKLECPDLVAKLTTQGRAAVKTVQLRQAQDLDRKVRNLAKLVWQSPLFTDIPWDAKRQVRHYSRVIRVCLKIWNVQIPYLNLHVPLENSPCSDSPISFISSCWKLAGVVCPVSCTIFSHIGSSMKIMG